GGGDPSRGSEEARLSEGVRESPAVESANGCRSRCPPSVSARWRSSRLRRATRGGRPSPSGRARRALRFAIGRRPRLRFAAALAFALGLLELLPPFLDE